jgi:WD40 repeat protein/transcriptional regulator with XRE-family HTH domain
MSVPAPVVALDNFTTFGDLLKYLRRRTGLTQRELSIAVGYSDAQISRLEQNQRLPDLPTIAARFVPALDLHHDPETATRLMELAAAVRREDAPALGLPPFKGLLYFDEADTDLFFGRETLAAHLTKRMEAGVQVGNRFLAVVGASGSGKSSVVRAGLVPALRWRSPSANWPIYVLTPSAHPLEALAAGLTREVESVAATATLTDDLARDPRSLHLAVRRVTQRLRASHAMIVVDQLEELFTLCHSHLEQNAFVDNLLTAAFEPDGPSIVVVALRADFYAHCADFGNLRQALAQHQEYIGPMSSEELRRAIEEPARRGQWEFEPGLVDLLLHDIGDEPGALPLLSHALLETWERRRGRTLTVSGYLAVGGVRGAIAETAEAVFKDQFDPHQQAIAREIFLRLTELGEGTQDTRRRAALAELVPRPEEAPAVASVLKTLADARLITTNAETVEVAHEALIREWPTLREWLAEDREGLRLHRHLTEAAQEWNSLNRDPGALYRGSRLAQAQEWVAGHPAELNTLEHEFLESSRQWAEREAAEREAHRQSELDSAQRLAETERRELQSARQLAETQQRAAAQLRRRALFLAGAFLLALAMAAIAFYFGDQARARATDEQQALLKAEQASRLSSSRELAAAAINNLDVDPQRSILLALQAVKVTYDLDQTWTTEAENALHRSVLASHALLTLQAHKAQVWSVAFSPDGKRLATASQDGTVGIWDAATGEKVLTLQVFSSTVLPLGGANSVAFSPDGKLLATGSDDAKVRLWDPATGQLIRTLSGHTDLVASVGFSPDGTRLGSASADKTAKVWDVATGRELLTLRGHTDIVASITFSPDNKRISTGSYDGTVKIWDGATGKESLTIQDDGPGIFSPDGTRVATFTYEWDAVTGKQLVTFIGHTNVINNVAYSRDGRRLATVSRDRTARVWDAATGKELLKLWGHAATISAVAFSPDGARLATGDEKGVINVWDLGPDREVLAVPPARPGTLDVRIGPFSPDSSRLFAAFNYGDSPANFHSEIDALDARSGRQLLTIPVGPMIWQSALSPDGKRLVTGGESGATRVWDASTGQELFRLNPPSITTYGVAFSPDGKRVATADADHMARMWDAATGQELFTLQGHTSTVTQVAFAPDGKRLMSASNDRTVKVWDVATGEELLTLPGFRSGAISPDGKLLASVSADSNSPNIISVNIYTLQIGDLVALAKSRLTRTWTLDECQTFLHTNQCP